MNGTLLYRNSIRSPRALGQTEEPPHVLKKRIGSTTYRVCVHFGQTSRESMNDKITRMIRNEAMRRQDNEDSQNILPLSTGFEVYYGYCE